MTVAAGSVASPSRSETCDVAIQGAGIAGLTLAIALNQRGYAVKIVERCPAPSEVGAGIWMATNAMQVFHRLGIADQIISAGWPIRLLRLQDHLGFDLKVTDLTPAASDFGFETTALHRAVLQRILFDQLAPGSVHFASEIEAITENPNQALTVSLSNGPRLHAKVVVGADGINSAIRHLIALGGVERHSGSSSYRAIARGMRPLPSGAEHEARELWGKGCRIGFSQINAEDTYWFMTFDAPAGETTTREERHAHAASLFRSSFPRWTALLDYTPANEILRTDIADLCPLQRWSSGSVGLVGDAAHASTPNLGQGGAMAVEDALALAEAFHSVGFNQAGWHRFETRRRAKVEWTVSTSRLLGRLCHLSNPVARGLRNTLARYTPKSIEQSQIRKMYTLDEPPASECEKNQTPAQV